MSLNTHLECAIEMLFIKVGSQVEDAVVAMERAVSIDIKDDYTSKMKYWYE